MAASIDELTVEGFKSIRKLEQFRLNKLNVLIGANGAGKSNFVELFRLVRAIAEQNLLTFINKAGGGDGLFFGGPKITSRINLVFGFGSNEYKSTLEPTADGRVVISNESMRCDSKLNSEWEVIGTGLSESGLKYLHDMKNHAGNYGGVGYDIYDSISKMMVYHFHDTSSLSPMRRDQSIEDTAYLRPDASNIAAFLRLMREQSHAEYHLIRDTIRLVAPFYDDFLLKQRKNGQEIKVALDWRQKGSDFPFQPWHLSDGTLRFICLATALLQPDPPPTIVIDEPELGLHPHALEVLAGLLQKASQRTQVIVSTQSAPLLSQFEPEDVITVCRKDGASVFGRLDRKELADWMKDYTLGELWQKNVVEAGATDD